MEGCDKVRDTLFDSDLQKHHEVREELEQYVERYFCSDYEYFLGLEVIHNEC